MNKTLDNPTLNALRFLARRIARLEGRDRDLSRESGAAFYSTESADGPATYYDEDGNERLSIGFDDDGRFRILHKNGPTPPKPNPPDTYSVDGGVLVVYDGTFVTDAIPSDLAYYEVHASPTPDCTADDTNLVGSIASPDGGTFVHGVIRPGIVNYYSIVAVNYSGVAGSKSDETAGTSGGVLAMENNIVVGGPGDATLLLRYVPDPLHSEHLYWNGHYQNKDQWSRVGNVVTIPDPDGIIKDGDEFVMEYFYRDPTPYPSGGDGSDTGDDGEIDMEIRVLPGTEIFYARFVAGPDYTYPDPSLVGDSDVLRDDNGGTYWDLAAISEDESGTPGVMHGYSRLTTPERDIDWTTLAYSFKCEVITAGPAPDTLKLGLCFLSKDGDIVGDDVMGATFFAAVNVDIVAGGGFYHGRILDVSLEDAGGNNIIRGGFDHAALDGIEATVKHLAAALSQGALWFEAAVLASYTPDDTIAKAEVKLLEWGLSAKSGTLDPIAVYPAADPLESDHHDIPATDADLSPLTLTAWRKFIPSVDTTLHLDTLLMDASADTVIYVWTGPWACPTLVGYNDDSSGTLSSLDVDVVADTAYYIMLGQWMGGGALADTYTLNATFDGTNKAV